jgi:hypothetical protein
MKLKLRRNKLFAPIMCTHCGEEIAIGHRYTGGDGKQVHEGCLRDKGETSAVAEIS